MNLSEQDDSKKAKEKTHVHFPDYPFAFLAGLYDSITIEILPCYIYATFHLCLQYLLKYLFRSQEYTKV